MIMLGIIRVLSSIRIVSSAFYPLSAFSHPRFILHPHFLIRVLSSIRIFSSAFYPPSAFSHPYFLIRIRIRVLSLPVSWFIFVSLGFSIVGNEVSQTVEGDTIVGNEVSQTVEGEVADFGNITFNGAGFSAIHCLKVAVLHKFFLLGFK